LQHINKGKRQNESTALAWEKLKKVIFDSVNCLTLLRIKNNSAQLFIPHQKQNYGSVATAEKAPVSETLTKNRRKSTTSKIDSSDRLK
jgi:hypothetical protein